jgi:hypothetical protein
VGGRRSTAYGIPRSRPAFRLGTVNAWARSARDESLSLAIERFAIYALTANPLTRRGMRRSTFEFEGMTLQYLSSRVQTERRVEIPLALDFLRRGPPKGSVLEIGHSLHNYTEEPRTIVDKYEVTDGVRNVDILDFIPQAKFETVISVSTLEHVGYDEPSRTHGKFLAAMTHLLNRCVTPTGRVLVTLPVGYNPEVDEFLRKPSDPRWRCSFLKRISIFNEWQQSSVNASMTSATRSRYPGCNVLAICRGSAEDQGVRPIP